VIRAGQRVGGGMPKRQRPHLAAPNGIGVWEPGSPV
jgi:hypothetical protein